jgi:pimeloyl-ACP methyl ester carboxylesterase
MYNRTRQTSAAQLSTLAYLSDLDGRMGAVRGEDEPAPIGLPVMELNHHRAGAGPPLLLMHGIGSRWQMWEPVLSRLTPHFDVIAVDLPGFGSSQMPAPGTAPGAQSLTTLVQEFLVRHDVDRPHVVGNSMGGLIALELARRGSARSATGLSPAGFGSRTEQLYAHLSLWAGVRVARWLAPRAEQLLSRPGARIAAVGQYVAHPGRLTSANAAADLRALAGAPWFDETLPRLRPREFTGGSEISVPVTIAWGAEDRLLVPRQLVRAGQELPQARLVVLRGCGHVPTYDDPDQVARVIIEAARE